MTEDSAAYFLVWAYSVFRKLSHAEPDESYEADAERVQIA
jgi:hypothetical protein